MKKDIEELIDMMTYQREARSPVEEQFIRKYIDSIPTIRKDAYGNRYKKVGKSDTMFACHTDTVHTVIDDGRQEVYVDNGWAHTNRENILGADNAIGIWLCIQMIKSRVPGLYVFHRDEEGGRHGSKYIASNNQKLLDGIKKVISFDRKDYDNLITHQGGRRCCSDEFAIALSRQLERYRLDPTGAYTDSASYMEIVPECTNLSIGYFNAHSFNESADLVFVNWLRNQLIQVDWQSLPVVRDPSPPVTSFASWGNSSYIKPTMTKEQPRKGKSKEYECIDCGYSTTLHHLGDFPVTYGLSPQQESKSCPRCGGILTLKRKRKTEEKKYYDYWNNDQKEPKKGDFFDWSW